MKVYIGPYKYHFNKFSLADALSDKLNLDDTKSDRLYDFFNKWVPDWPFNLLNRLQGTKRKIKVRIDTYDVWGADYTLALIILPALIELKKIKHGSPHVDDEDVPENLRSTSAKPVNTDIGETDEFFHERWNYVLDQMIWSFDAIVRSDFYEEVFYPEGSAFDAEGYKAHNEKIETGLKLFGKYYRGLWD